jgi:anti-sigma-K factor RskA
MDSAGLATAARLHEQRCVNLMNLINNPELLNHLAQTYALGTLRGRARARLETMAKEQPPVRAQILLWQSHFASITELQPASQPDRAVWMKIDNLVQAEVAATNHTPVAITNPPKRWWRNLGLWQSLTATAVIALLALSLQWNNQLGSLQAQLSKAKTEARVQYVAVLNDALSKEAILVTIDASRNELKVKRVGAFRETPEQSLQLWTIAPDAKPKSLGVLSTEEIIKLVSLISNPAQAQLLAVSLEPKGGVPEAGGPTGPVLFKGALLKSEI